MTPLYLPTGVIATSLESAERRVGLHPRHFDRLSAPMRSAIVLENGYGRRFGWEDSRLESHGFSLASREEVLESCEIVLLPKPHADDLRRMSEGHILWGWPHCVRQRELTQVAIERRLTLLAFEAMFLWGSDGERGPHTFYRSNELAGYCAVQHALGLAGWDGWYGQQRRALLLGFDSVGRGAAYALAGRGISDITVLTRRSPQQVPDPIPGATHGRMRRPDRDGEPVTFELEDGAERPLVEFLGQMDVVVNGTLQDPEDPLTYLREGEESHLREGSLILDVSCDEGMGFPFARPTSFEEPTFRVGPSLYYAVDHTPTYLWDSASFEISDALLPYLHTVMSGPEAWKSDATLARAVEIRGGRILNPVILALQNRGPDPPHPILG